MPHEPERRDYYVYVLLDPSKDDEPFYVGKGRGYRRLNHYCPSYVGKRSHKSNVIQRYRRMGLVDKHEVIAEGLSEAQAFDIEREAIKRLGRRCNGGPLVNQTDGGEGASGHSVPRTAEWKRKISASLTGKPHTVQHVENSRRARLGKPIPDAQREKISNTLMGVRKTADHRRALSEALRGKPKSPEHRAAMIGRSQPRQGRWYRVVDPTGTIFVLFGMNPFCRTRGLLPSHLGGVALGKRKHHRGWTAQFCDQPDRADPNIQWLNTDVAVISAANHQGSSH